MKLVIPLALFCLSSPLLAQVGAKVDQIVVSKSFGTSLVLKHCEALEVKDDGIKVKHDDGTYVVPLGNLPEAWKKWVANKKVLTDTARKEESERAQKEAKEERERDEMLHWKTIRHEDGSEVLRIRVVSAWGDSLVVELMKSAPPVADTLASIGGGGNVAPGGYNPSGTIAVLSGTLPKDFEDNQMYTVLAKKAEIRKFQGKNLPSYLVSRFEKGVAP